MHNSYPGLILVTPPTTEPVTVDELAMQLRISDTSEYPLLQHYITATRMMFEEMTGLALQKQQWRVFYHRHHHIHFNQAEWYWWEALPADMHHHVGYYLPKSPVQSIVSVVGDKLNQQYNVNTTVQPSILTIQHEVKWLNVEFWAGYDCVPAPIKQAIMLQAASYYLHREGSYPGSLTEIANGFKQICDLYRVRLP